MVFRWAFHQYGNQYPSVRQFLLLKIIHLVFWNFQTGVLPLHLKLSPVGLRIWCQPYLATNRNVCLASCFSMPKIQHSEMNKNRSQKTQNVQTGIMLVPCLVWRHARACGKFLCGIFLPLLSKMCQPTDFCVQTHFVLLVLDFELCCTSLPLLYTSKASKRIMYILFLANLLKYACLKSPALSDAKINAPRCCFSILKKLPLLRKISSNIYEREDRVGRGLTRHFGRWELECRSSSCPGRGCRCLGRGAAGSGASTRARGWRAARGGDCLAGGGNPARSSRHHDYIAEMQNTRCIFVWYDVLF